MRIAYRIGTLSAILRALCVALCAVLVLLSWPMAAMAQSVTASVSISGTGTGTITGNGINCSTGSNTGCSTSIGVGTTVTLTQMATNGTFAGWSAVPTACTVSGQTCTFQMPAGGEAVLATFNALAGTPILTVQILGSGSGSVTGNGIQCSSGDGGGCATGVAAGTPVTLTEMTIGGTFGRWSAPCSNTATTCSFSMPAGGQFVAATFTATPTSTFTLTPNQLFFGPLALNTKSAPQALTATNEGASAVTITGISFVGNAAADFGQTNACNGSVGGDGGQCMINVTATPSAAGPRTADLNLASSDPSSPAVSHMTANGTILQLPGFATNVFPANDDGSSSEITLPFPVNFFGTTYSSLFVNNNGNVTFGQPLSEFTPSGLTGDNGGIPIIAPFWADVDTTGSGSSLVTFGTDTVNGRQAFGVDYENVGYFSSNFDKLNSFQVILIDRSDTGAGNFDIEFNYDKIQWEVGDASGGTNGLCGAVVPPACVPAAVGYSNGTGTAGTSFQLNGSFLPGALLDGGPAATSLIANDLNSGTLGQYMFQVRSGVVQPSTLMVATAGTGTGTVMGNGISCTSGSATGCTVNPAAGTQVTLTETGTNGSSFAGWNGAPTPCTVAGLTCTFTMPVGVETVTATFTSGMATVPLMVATAGTGTGTVTGAGINCTSGSANGCTANVTAGTQVTLTEMIGANSSFTSWSAPCPNTTSPTCLFTMPAVATMITATFTLNAPTLVSIAVTPADQTVPINSTQQYTATGTYSDNSKKDITATVTWASSNGDAATINPAGLAMTGSTPGLMTTISASLNQTAGSTTLTVSSSPISISVTPPPGGVIPPVPPGGKLAVGIVLTSTPGFSGTVTLGCTVTGADGQPAPSITCIPDPNTVTLSPGGPTQEAIVVNTFCTADTVPLGPNSGGLGGGLRLLLLSLTLGGLVWTYRRGPRLTLSFAVLMLIALGGSSCAQLPKGPNGVTPPGNYILTIRATVNGVTTSTPPIPFTVE